MRATSRAIRGLCALALLACLLAAWLPAPAQVPGRSASPASAPAAQAQAQRDPLERGTPRRAVAAFARAAQRGDMQLALRYVQGGNRPTARTEALVRDLGALMDRYFHQAQASISDAPEGALDDGLPLDRERVGPLRVGRQKQYIELVRVEDPVSGPVWLVSAETLAHVPELREGEGRSWLERLLPEPLFAHAVFDFTFADLLVATASILLPLALLPALFKLLHLLVRHIVRSPEQDAAVDAWYAATRGPAVVVVTLAIHLACLVLYGPTLSFRIAYARVLMVLLALALGWGFKRASAVLFGRAGAHLQDRGHTGVRSVMMLGERLMNVVILLAVLLVVLALLGFEMRTVLAGLGIVGVALALGAQKTIENILGGMMLLGDEALAVGDLCRVNNRLGTVEDITLRSVRFRTQEHTLLSIPAGVLAQADIENFASRRKFLAQHRLRLANDTSAQQLRRVRTDIAALIDANPDLEHPLSRVRLVDVGPLGMELEIYAHVLTSDVPKFNALREDLLLQVVAAVEAAGARFADAVPWAQPPPPGPPR